jgi:pimeloyl-ACP methyl ester carboxylesterase/protein-tyrosine phosphatase
VRFADTEVDDPALLKKHSEIRSFTTSRFTYPSLRIFFRRHPQAEKLPTTPASLPLLVFVHGLGGSSYQFHSLLSSMVHLASCLSIDLPGCGLSAFAPTSWDAYTTEALAELLEKVIEEYREKETGQGVVLIGHSMGGSLAALLATHNSLHPRPLSDHVVGLVAICPRAEPPTKDEVALFRKLLYIPTPIFDLWRKWDRRGGLDSASVRRFVGRDADEETKKLQDRFNKQSRSAVWRRMAFGSLPIYKDGVAHGGLPGREVWAGLDCPVFLVAGEADRITRPTELAKIASFLGKSHPVQIELNEDSEPIVDSAAPVDISSELRSSNQDPGQIDTAMTKEFCDGSADTSDSHEDPSTPNEELATIPPQLAKPKKVLKTTILPAPASHALLYMPSTVRILAGLISDFMCSQVSPRLSLGWQLQFLSTAGKWDVKNLAKWQAVAQVSEPIAGIFRAMKTLRQVDDTHSPEIFVRNWGSQIKDIIDISHDTPVYDPRDLERGGVRYYKFPTVSKIPPTNDEVNTFITLVDRIREEQKPRAEKEGWGEEWYIGVHCHYGFNRTGYFIVCYLVERCGYSVQGAIDEFAKRRPKGIKHAHFLDQLFVRYCVGLKRAPTL